MFPNTKFWGRFLLLIAVEYKLKATLFYEPDNALYYPSLESGYSAENFLPLTSTQSSQYFIICQSPAIWAALDRYVERGKTGEKSHRNILHFSQIFGVLLISVIWWDSGFFCNLYFQVCPEAGIMCCEKCCFSVTANSDYWSLKSYQTLAINYMLINSTEFTKFHTN